LCEIVLLPGLRQRLQTPASSKEEIMTFLDGVSLEKCDSFASLEELNEDEEQVCT